MVEVWKTNNGWKEMLIPVLMIAIGVITISTGIMVKSLEPQLQSPPITEQDKPARFEAIDTLTIEKFKGNKSDLVKWPGNGDLTGIVYRDKETDIEYLYIWTPGGISMTRLWKAEEKSDPQSIAKQPFNW